jgi:hypothetical protein
MQAPEPCEVFHSQKSHPKGAATPLPREQCKKIHAKSGVIWGILGEMGSKNMNKPTAAISLLLTTAVTTTAVAVATVSFQILAGWHGRSHMVR